MFAAIVIAIGFMLVFSGTVGDFVNRHPTVKMLALSFLLLIGMSLVAEGLDQHIPKGYIYFAMGFSVLVEMLNLRAKKGKPVHLHNRYAEPAAPPREPLKGAPPKPKRRGGGGAAAAPQPPRPLPPPPTPTTSG